MQFRHLVFLIFSTLSLSVSAQIGGEYTYRFLSMPNSARVAALGGNQVAINDSTDLNLPFQNPALLHENMANHALFNYVNYLTDINYGYASYAYSFGRMGMVAAGMHFISYGNFVGATEEGELSGNNFKAGEYALNLIYSNKFRKWRYGVNLKPVYSNFESYNSFGIAADLGLSYISSNQLTTFGFAARNFGSQLTTYYKNGDFEKLPFDLVAGISQKLAHAPVSIAITAHQLNNWTLAKPDKGSTSNEELFYEPRENFGKQLMRHLVMGAEVYPSPNFTLRAGYNYHLRQELKVDQKLSTVGFSLGFGVNVKRFSLDYANTRLHLAGSSHIFSIAFNLNRNF